ncbi:hypothetical protein LZQ00_06940 [Sphingobacterium sp. SRCM116780]|uniref:hypothetical protein n=1 Tax=Sphingobacterium sp. SRCM116780 TaxID=2907623 RepID=UPI001F2A5E0F|nr:hypothetical protein [Sphingobacterium sp. SRCM116780]UIR57548.1 hypothetical protein LZQ00_06940 [Sphingobacterium sp. SRCM116780]
MKNLTIIVLALLTFSVACKNRQKSSDEDAALKSITVNDDDAKAGTITLKDVILYNRNGAIKR